MTGVISLFRRLDRLTPRAAIRGRAWCRKSFRQLTFAKTGNDIDRRLRTLAGIDFVIPFAALWRGHQPRISAHQLREKAHPVRVIRHHQEIQRPRKFRMLATGSDDLLALGKTIGVLWTEPGAERASVHRKRCM